MTMPLLAPAQTEQTERKAFRLKKETIAKISAYAAMIQSPEDHVVTGALNRFFSSDKDFQQYLMEQTSPLMEVPSGKKRRGRPSKMTNPEGAAVVTDAA